MYGFEIFFGITLTTKRSGAGWLFRQSCLIFPLFKHHARKYLQCTRRCSGHRNNRKRETVYRQFCHQQYLSEKHNAQAACMTAVTSLVTDMHSFGI